MITVIDDSRYSQAIRCTACLLAALSVLVERMCMIIGLIHYFKLRHLLPKKCSDVFVLPFVEI